LTFPQAAAATEINIKISCDNKLIKGTKNTKFLGLAVDSNLSVRLEQTLFYLG
jgi:hypothetical protein